MQGEATASYSCSDALPPGSLDARQVDQVFKYLETMGTFLIQNIETNNSWERGTTETMSKLDGVKQINNYFKYK